MTLTQDISIDVIQAVTAQQAGHYGILPYKMTEDELYFLIKEENVNTSIVSELELITGKRVHILPAPSDEVNRQLAFYYKKSNDRKAQSISWEDFASSEKDTLVALLAEAYTLNVSDIHLEPYEENCRIRFRLNGSLFEKFRIDKRHYSALVNKVKIKSKLDIAEKRLPQDGRMLINLEGDQFDIRVSTIPTLYSEKIVMRILGKDASQIDLNKLGFHQSDLERYLRGIHKPHGMVLISGPTGSGKTTTLYGTLKLLNDTERNVITIEDPIEYTMEGINQVQLKENIGLSYPKALRTFLRQDPDIIMVGEIRDEQTASMAIRASLTGHLVLSTIHTNSAWGIVGRLLDMGVPAYLLADTLNTVVAQRLVKALCESCKKPIESVPEQYRALLNGKAKNSSLQLYSATGCGQCGYTGYTGRTAIYEVIHVDEILTEKIRERTLDISDYRNQSAHRTLQQNALDKVCSGQTTIEEIAPIISYV